MEKSMNITLLIENYKNLFLKSNDTNVYILKSMFIGN